VYHQYDPVGVLQIAGKVYKKRPLYKPVFKAAAGLCLIIIGLCNTAWNPFHPQLRTTTNFSPQKSSREKRLTLDYR